MSDKFGTLEMPVVEEDAATEVLTSMCTLDCPDGCTLEVKVERAGERARDGIVDRVVSIGGVSQGHPTTRGFICAKVGRFADRLDHQDRILRPLRRTGPKGSGRFEAISWDQALELVAGRFREIADRWGAEAILPCHYGGSNGMMSDGLVDQHFFARLGASRLAKTICAAPTSAVATGMYGKMAGVAYEDYPEARAILIWGANPKASGIHLVPFLRQAKERGAFIAVIDPMCSFSPREIDLHLPVYPGTDLPLALGLIHRWQQQGRLDHDFLARRAVGAEPLLSAAAHWSPQRAAAAARVPLDDLLRLADTFAEASPAVVRCGWGLERNRNGGQAVAAVMAIPALLGKFGVRGGGYTMSNSRASVFTPPPELQVPSWQTRVIDLTRLGAALDGEADPPVRALFVYNCNPLVTVPEQNRVLRGLEREGLFTVVHEQVMTDTALYADVVLPATTMLEHRDVRVGYGAFVLGAAQPVVPPRGEARSNVATFTALGRALGFDDPVFALDDEQVFDRVVAGVEMVGHSQPDRALLAAGRTQLYDFPGPTPIQFGTVFPPTADGKAHLTPSVLGPEPYAYLDPDLDTYPLTLISPATQHLINSIFGESSLDRLEVTLHPDDATRRGIATGDPVRVHNASGEVWCHARVSDRIRPGVVAIPKGAWRRSSANAQTSTALCPDHGNVVAGGACYNDARVEVGRRGE